MEYIVSAVAVIEALSGGTTTATWSGHGWTRWKALCLN